MGFDWHTLRKGWAGLVGMLALALLLLAGCRPAAQAEQAVDLAGVLKTLEEAPAWQAAEAVQTFDHDHLYDLMDGQSDAYFAYGFEQAGVQRFTYQAEPGTVMVAAVYQVDAADSAYGLYSKNQDGEALALGSEGCTTPGRRLQFWQSRYFVQLTALKPVADADLRAAGEAIAAALPKGGERPALMASLPQGGSQAVFFHLELSIQDQVWLGGENRLALGPDTDGALARYPLPGSGEVWLMLVEYPDAQRAQAAVQTLRAGDFDDLLAVDGQDRRAAAVFGKGDGQAAQALLDSALTQ